MTHFSDGLEVGGAVTNTVVGSNGGLGLKVGELYIYDVVPLTKSANGFAAAAVSAGGAITLSAGTGIAAVVDAFGVTRYTMDIPRAVSLTSSGNDTGITATVVGYDVYGQRMTNTFALANAGLVNSTKTFLSIISVTLSGAAAGTVSVGTSDVFGMPIAVRDRAYYTYVGWNNTLGFHAATASTVADATAATATTTDVRGTITPASVADGVKRLVVNIAMSSLQSGSLATTSGCLGVAQF